METRKPNILFATPCYGGMISSTTTMSYMKLIKKLENRKIRHKIQFLNNQSLITKARNQFVSYFLERRQYTHLMFIDADMGFEAETFLELLSTNKLLAGCPYPAKTINWEKMFSKIQSVKNSNNLLEYGTEYVGKETSERNEPNITLENVGSNMLKEVAYLGTGFMLIKRELFEKMMEEQPDKFYTPDYHMSGFRKKREKHYAFFENGIWDGEYRGEDYYFCAKWRKMGGKIWMLYPRKKITHLGNFKFIG